MTTYYNFKGQQTFVHQRPYVVNRERACKVGKDTIKTYAFIY